MIANVPQEEVVEEAPQEEVVEEAPKEEAVEEVPQEEVAEEAPKEEVAEEAPKEEVVEEAPKEEAVEEAPQEEVVEEAPKEEVVKEAPQEEVVKEVPKKEVVEEISKKEEKSIFGEPVKQKPKKKKGCFFYFLIITLILAIIAYFAEPYYMKIYYDYIGEKVEKENDNAVVEADTLQQNSEQDSGVSGGIENSSDTAATKKAQNEPKITQKNEAPRNRTEAEKQTDADIAQAIAAVLKGPEPEPEPAPKPVSEPKAKPKVETSNKGDFYKTSFNCENTNNATALTICTNEELARLDVRLNKLYQPLRIILEEDQQEWRKTLSKCKVDINCLDKTYRDRIKVLKEVQ